MVEKQHKNCKLVEQFEPETIMLDHMKNETKPQLKKETKNKTCNLYKTDVLAVKL